MLKDEKKIKDCGEKGIPMAKAGKDIPDRGKWRTLMPVIDLKRCIKCKTCWIHCPDAAIKLKKNDQPYSDSKTCKGCGVCADVCPVKCITMVREKK